MTPMRFLLGMLLVGGLFLCSLQAQDRDGDQDGGRSGELTPTAPRKVTMANPVKPDWLPQPHGK